LSHFFAGSILSHIFLNLDRIATFALGYTSTFLLGGWNRLVIGAKGLRLAFWLLGTGMKTLFFGGFGAAALAVGGLSLASSGLRKEIVGGLAEDLGIVGTELEEVTTAASKGLSPAFEVLKKHAGTVSETLRKRFAPELEALEKIFKPVSEKFTAIFKDISTKFEKGLLPHFNAFKKQLKAFTKSVSDAFAQVFKKDSSLLGAIINVVPVIEAISKILTRLSAGEIGQVIAGIGLLGGSLWFIARTIGCIGNVRSLIYGYRRMDESCTFGSRPIRTRVMVFSKNYRSACIFGNRSFRTCALVFDIHNSL
jgi:hypothetical protein